MNARIFEARASGAFTAPGLATRCALGKGGSVAASEKREGDHKSPLGDWPLRHVFYRPDRQPPPMTELALVPLTPFDGWCDDPRAAALYNRHLLLPSPWSCERLWRDDGVYDFIVVLGHNDAPAVAGLGSAIFLHLKRGDYEGTEGCVALAVDDMLTVLALARAGDILRISS